MLELKQISKDYQAGDAVVHALKNVSIRFRRHEFVAVLGPSGCGKTTLLNIIGGLDQYTSGDLIISGRSTRDFSGLSVVISSKDATVMKRLPAEYGLKLFIAT